MYRRPFGTLRLEVEARARLTIGHHRLVLVLALVISCRTQPANVDGAVRIDGVLLVDQPQLDVIA